MSTTRTTTPTVAGHLLLGEPKPTQQDPSWDSIPPEWTFIRFDAVNILNISPFVVDVNNKTFRLGTADHGTGNLTARFNWVVANARAQNPKIKLIALQFYGTDPYTTDTDLTGLKNQDDIETYTDSVAAFLQSWQNKTLQSDSGQTVSARIDGWDVDYEYPNVVPTAPLILSQLRQKVDAVSTNPKFRISITPDTWQYLTATSVSSSLDYVNMQNYDGGRGMTGDVYLANIPNLKPEQLVYGITAEAPWLNDGDVESSIAAVKTAVETGAQGVPFSGIMMWRLNSNNTVYENMVQVVIYNSFNSPPLPNSPTLDVVQTGWNTGGRNIQDAKNGVPVCPFVVAPWPPTT